MRTLIAFVREPDPATCKTRLSPALSPPERVAFYRAMLADLAETMENVPCDRRIFSVAPETFPVTSETGTLVGATHASPTAPERRGARPCAPTGTIDSAIQQGDNLGERMLNALLGAGLKPTPPPDRRGARQCAPTSTIVIGSDAPLLSASDILAAFELLERRNLVLTPTYDGGYCLIGAQADIAEELPMLFEGMTWSHSRVFEETLLRIRRIQAQNPAFSFGLLPMRYDVDTPDDLALLTAHLDGLALAGEPVPRHTYAFLKRGIRPENLS